MIDTFYSGAYFTIIAAAPVGLLGSDSSLQARRIPTTTKDHYEALLGAKWATRGWTFQEQILSNRAVVFLGKFTIRHDLRVYPPIQMQGSGRTGRHIFWDCQCECWGEIFNPKRVENVPDDDESRTDGSNDESNEKTYRIAQRLERDSMACLRHIHRERLSLQRAGPDFLTGRFDRIYWSPEPVELPRRLREWSTAGLS
jgi:hypothetical protein